MENSILQQISSLNILNLAALTEKYAELFDGEKPHSANIEHIRRKIAYRLQELASGTLPDEAKNGLNVRIPELVSTHSGKSSPPIPLSCIHLSERSDASFILYQRS